MKDPESDVDAAIEVLGSELADYVTKLVGVFPGNAYPGNVFKNQTRVATLLKEAGLTS